MFAAVAILVAVATQARPADAQGSDATSEAAQKIARHLALYTPRALRIVDALAARMRGAADSNAFKGILFADAANAALAARVYRTDPLTLHAFDITANESIGSDLWRLLAGLEFRDEFGRRTVAGVAARYQIVGQDIVIYDAAARPIFDADPEVVLHLVPAEAVPAKLLKPPSTSGDLLRFAAGYSRRPDGSPKPPPGGERDYYAFAFFFDRLAPDTRVGLRISDRREGVSGDSKSVIVLRNEVWHVAVARARFEIGGGDPVYFKVFVAPGKEVPEDLRRPRLVGLFSSKLRSPGAARPPPSAPVKPSPATE